LKCIRGLGLIKYVISVTINLADLEVKSVLIRSALCQVNEAHWKPKGLAVALKTLYCPHLTAEELSDFKRELWLTRFG